MAFEELGEVRWVIETQTVTDLLNGHRTVEQRAVRFLDQALVDDRLCRLSKLAAADFRQSWNAYSERFGVEGWSVLLRKMLLDKRAEPCACFV